MRARATSHMYQDLLYGYLNWIFSMIKKWEKKNTNADLVRYQHHFIVRRVGVLYVRGVYIGKQYK